MLKRCWVLVAALALASLANPSWPQDAENKIGTEDGAAASNARSAEQQGDPIDYTPALDRIESAIRDLVAEEDKAAKEREESQQARDLKAQEDMAYWAEWMFWTTLATAFLTFFGLLLIARTLYHTSVAADHTEQMLRQAEMTTAAAVKSTEIAESSAKAALEANRQAARISEVDARAYLTASGVKLVVTDDENEMLVRLTLRNVGKSPAYNITVVRFCICEDAHQGDFSGQIPQLGPERTLIATLPPGADAVCTFPIYFDHAVDSRLIERPGEPIQFVDAMIAYQTVYDLVRRRFSGDLALKIYTDEDTIGEANFKGSVAIDHFSAGHRSGWMDHYLKEVMGKNYDRRVWDYRPGETTD